MESLQLKLQIHHLLPPLTASTSSLPHTLNGIVFVGVISRKHDESSQLINRVLGTNAFGSGRREKTLDINKEELNHWIESRRINYCHEEGKRSFLLQFCSTMCHVLRESSDSESVFDSVVEENEFWDLQGLFFMFVDFLRRIRRRPLASVVGGQEVAIRHD
ncbi:hypothetical protein Dsin_029456 [Dipteronia sinensis]|uniref:Nonsense-mediated mRNA decay factor SMG8 n=1 Tax=Dipteronia sinensis TaxID=43782 RepID=A0AAE0DVE2_9ROSI|nr:hypothetical protein Dsin_029456 [Dipteronia sinensis]